MKILDEQVLDALAELICGDRGPLRRSGSQLPYFFRNAGLYCPDHDGSTRKWWTLERLQEYSDEPDSIEKILLRLADPREYKLEPEKAEEARNKLNTLLAFEGYKIELSGVKPQLLRIEPSFPQNENKKAILEPSDFNKLSSDSNFNRILYERWQDAQKCIEVEAYVPAIVMMGSLLEGVLIAKIQKNPSIANKAKTSPKDREGNVKKFYEWSLRELIDVASECGWIHIHVKEFSHILRDYRNLVHPWHQLTKTNYPDKDTCEICWNVVKAALNNLIESV